MQSQSWKHAFKLKREGNSGSTSQGHRSTSITKQNCSSGFAIPGNLESTCQGPIGLTSSEDNCSRKKEDSQKQLVVYDPAANGTSEAGAVPDLTEKSRVSLFIGGFAAKCAKCFKWRLIPTKEKFEEIREYLSEEHPFICESASEWRLDASCDDPADIVQDGSRIWAIDKPNIARPPPGWERTLKFRREGGTKFADVFYFTPSGKRLRSTVEIRKYLDENPNYIKEGVRMSQFSFKTPEPLQENYVRKSPARCVDLEAGSHSGMSRSVKPSEAQLISCSAQGDDSELQGDVPGQTTPRVQSPGLEPKTHRPRSRRKIVQSGS